MTARAAAAVTTLAAALGGLSVPAAARADPPRCLHTGEVVVAASAEAVVMHDRKRQRFVGCLRRDGTRRTIWAPTVIPNGFESVDRVRLTGAVVAFVVSSSSTVFPGVYATVRVVDLGNGRRREVRKVRDALPYGVGVRIRALDVNACGTVAYVAAAYGGGWRNLDADRQLRVSDAYGEPQLVDAGLVELRSVRIGGERVVWRRDGRRLAYQLPVGCLDAVAG